MHQKKVIGEERYLKNYFWGLFKGKTLGRKPKNAIKSSWNVVTR
jgi:hypothetical protein